MKSGKLHISLQEALFQVVLHLVVFVFYSFDKNEPQFKTYQLAFFLNYALSTLIISYLLLPRFFYCKKYLHFFAGLAVVIAAMILVEELVIERIYFPDTRGQHFPGVFFTFLEVLPVVTVLSGFKFAWDALKKQREVDELKAAIKESELQFLKSQLNPHFLFNILNNLYAYAIELSPRTPEIILDLSTVLRYVLYECQEEYVPLDKEIEHLEKYTVLNQLQVEERGEVSFLVHHIEPGYRIASLILVVFIENAFKHSQASQSENILIEIALGVNKSGELQFECRNTFQPNTNTEHLSKGIGLANVRKRLQLLYPNAHDLQIDEENGYFTVNLRMQLRNGAGD